MSRQTEHNRDLLVPLLADGHSRLAGFTTLCAAAALLVGCVMSPIPQPPNLDTKKMSAQVCTECPEPEVLFQGAAGAVSGEGTSLWVDNLDNDASSQLHDVDDDGSFEISVAGGLEDTFRFYVWIPSSWSAAFDVVVDNATGDVLPASTIREAGGECDYVDVAGICTATNVDDYPNIHCSYTPNDSEAPIPEWFDVPAESVSTTVESPVSIGDSFPCECHIIISGACTPVRCEPI